MENNDSKMIIGVKEETYGKKKKAKKDALSEHFKDKVKELDEKFGIKLNKKEIALKLDMTYEQFRKIINKQQPTKHRDCIIAISAVIGGDSADTDEALECNDYMHKLDEESGRDLLIMNILDSHRRRYDDGRDELDYNPDIIDEINNELTSKHYPPLDIINHRNTVKAIKKRKEKDDKLKYPYKLIKKKLINTCDLSILKSSYETEQKSLSKKYVNTASVFAAMEFDNKGKKIVISYILYGDHNLDKDVFYRVDGSGLFLERKAYTDIEDTGELKNSFVELKNSAYDEIKKSDTTFNDTRNFIQRMSARVIDGDLHVFIEKFNYELPLCEEYYLMDYSNGKYIMTVSKNSRFMKFYLPNDVYQKKYGYVRDKIVAEYKDESDISVESVIKEETERNINYEIYSSSYSLLSKCRRRYYDMLKKEIDSFIKRLKRGDEVIKDPNYIFPKLQYSVITRFNAEKEFQCIWAPDEALMSLNQETLDRINAAPDVDPSFDFDAAYNNTCKLESIDDRINERENLKLSYLKLKLKQGKKLEDIDYTLYDSKNLNIIVGIDNPTPAFMLSDGREVKLSVKDLIEGEKLGITTIEELGQLILKHNSLKIKDLL